ncbi:hypothetical protein LTR36_002211 [Oleoguttula mirabilis]|uniref:Uncharacterized protein n=1 Tax=Oleoguttula mirabilis TaxID=1507867 RepID=A0AAV9JLB8_9PEZI|nr:hypothetical protein LTR36_002211 [Oleoguttula mirabilis]
MSRQVAEISGLGLQHFLRTATAATATPTNRLLSTTLFISRIRTATRRAPLFTAVRSFSASAFTDRDGTAKDTPVRWARPAAPKVGWVGPRRGLHAAHSIRTLSEGRSIACYAAVQRRWKSDLNPAREERVEHAQKTGEEAASGAKASHDHSSGRQQYILDRLPHLHRPTKEELLAAATGFWHRLQIRFKWFSIRSARPFNSDEIGAFLSWIFWGHVLWIVVGTTTFVSGAIWAINTVFAQETLAGWVGNYLTKSSGVKIVFESAIVPTWNSGVITFNNVFVSRRPGSGKRQRAVSKGSSTAAAEAANLASQTKESGAADHEDDSNYTQFDVTIQTVNVSLSFAKWFNGKGLLRDVEVHGVRGVVDRTSVHPTGEVRDPKSYRHEHNTGDFELDSFKMEDVLITIYQPNDFRPFTVSVYNCELPRLRKQWLFYDFMCANNMSGSFDDSLFTIHPRQVHGITGVSLNGEGSEMAEDAGQWKKHSRLRIDGLQIDHLNRGVNGPFSWIQEGNVDIVADVMIPNDEDGSIAKVMSDFYDRMEATVTNVQQSTQRASENIIRNDQNNGAEDGAVEQDVQQQQPLQRNSSSPSEQRGRAEAEEEEEEDTRFLVLDIRVHLNDVKASIPLLPNPSLSYINTTLIRPIVAYINSRRAFIPVNCRVVKKQSEFDGSWTIFDSGLLDDLSRETYDAFVRDIGDEGRRRRRMKKVGLWTIQLAAQALFLGLAGQLA